MTSPKTFLLLWCCLMLPFFGKKTPADSLGDANRHHSLVIGLLHWGETQWWFCSLSKHHPDQRPDCHKFSASLSLLPQENVKDHWKPYLADANHKQGRFHDRRDRRPVIVVTIPPEQQMEKVPGESMISPSSTFLTSFLVGKPTGPQHIMEVHLISWKSHLAMSFLDIQCCLLSLTFCMNISQLASRNWVGSATNVLPGASRTTRNPGREVKMNNAAAKCPCLLWKLS